MARKTEPNWDAINAPRGLPPAVRSKLASARMKAQHASHYAEVGGGDEALGRSIVRQRSHERAAAVKGLHSRRIREAMPPWADREAIAAIYVEAVRLTVATGIPHEVDHIEPLLGRGASGLHVAYNLRVVSRAVNRRKGNRRE